MAGGENAGRAEFAAVFTRLNDQRVLAAVMALGGCKGRTLLTSAGALGVLDDTSRAAVDRAGQVVSNFAKNVPIVVIERTDGQLSVRQWAQGHPGESLPPGLSLNDAPGVVLSLASGAQSFDDVAPTHEDKIADARMSKWKAFRTLRNLAKETRGRLETGSQPPLD